MVEGAAVRNSEEKRMAIERGRVVVYLRAAGVARRGRFRLVGR
jgi:hypothetical protein